MAEEQNTPVSKNKLPIKTKIAAWMLLVVATIVCLLSIVIFIAGGASANVDISMYAPLAAMIGFGIALVYFLPGILLLKARSRGLWISAVVILCAVILGIFVFLLVELFKFTNSGLPPEYLGIEYRFVYLLLSFLIPLILVLLDKVTYKVVVFIPISMVIVVIGCFYSVRSDAGSYYNQAAAFDTRMYTELHDLYGKAVEDRNIKGCQGCEEVNQYFYEQWNRLDPKVKAQSDFYIDNGIRYTDCLQAIAYLTENISVCNCVEAIDGNEGSGSDHEQCRKTVQALAAEDVSICSGGDECTTIFSIMTDNPSLCDQLPYYDVDNCHARYNQSQEDPYNYLGLFWRPPEQ